MRIKIQCPLKISLIAGNSHWDNQQLNYFNLLSVKIESSTTIEPLHIYVVSRVHPKLMRDTTNGIVVW